MKTFTKTVLISAIFAAMALPALAQVEAGTSEVGIHAGIIWGDDLTEAVSGSTAELDDSAAVGLSYAYNFTNNWAAEARYTWNISKVEGASNNPDLDVHLFDLNALYNLNPASKIVTYLTAGIGMKF